MGVRMITCGDCDGVGCPKCVDGKVEAKGHGGKLIAIGEDTEVLVIALNDKVDDLVSAVADVMNKCNDIFEAITAP